MKSKIILILIILCFVAAVFDIYGFIVNQTAYNKSSYDVRDVYRINMITCAISSLFFFLLGGSLIIISSNINEAKECIDYRKKEIKELNEKVSKLKARIDEMENNK